MKQEQMIMRKRVHGERYREILRIECCIMEKQVATYAQTTFFPRMYWSHERRESIGIKNGQAMIRMMIKERRKERWTATSYIWREHDLLCNYQVNWMYWRYFMWNFLVDKMIFKDTVDAMRGNWISGFSAVDEARLGSQRSCTLFTQENPSNNTFFFLPLILGLIGLIFHFYRTPKDAFVLF